MEFLGNTDLFGSGLGLSLTAWFIGWGFAKAINTYKTITS